MKAVSDKEEEKKQEEICVGASDTPQVENRTRVELPLSTSPENIQNAIKLLISHPAGRHSEKHVVVVFFIQLSGLLSCEVAPHWRQRPPTPDRHSVRAALASVKSQ